MREILESLEKDLLVFLFVLTMLSGFFFLFGHVLDVASFITTGFYILSIGIFASLVIIAYENAVQVDIVEEQLMKLNKEMVKWRESQNREKKGK